MLNLLRLGAYQLLQTRIPTHAAVATTVDLAKATGNARASGFVNAMLRKVAARDFDGWCDLIGADASRARPAGDPVQPPGLDRRRRSPPRLPRRTELRRRRWPPTTPGRRPTWSPGPAGSSGPSWPTEAGGDAGPYSPYAVRLTTAASRARWPRSGEHKAGVQDEGSQLCALALARIGRLNRAGRTLAGPVRRPRWQGRAAGRAGRRPGRRADRQRAAPAPGRTGRAGPPRAGRSRSSSAMPAQLGRRARLRPGPAGRAVHRAGRAAPPARGALAPRTRPTWPTWSGCRPTCWTPRCRLVRPGGVVGYVTCSPHLAETDQPDRAAAGRRHAELELLDARPAFAGRARLDDADRPAVAAPARHRRDVLRRAAPPD